MTGRHGEREHNLRTAIDRRDHAKSVVHFLTELADACKEPTA